MASAAPFAIPPPPPGLNYIELIRPCLTLLMICTVWSSVLVPLLILLFLSSNKELRMKPIFILNIICVLLGIAMGLLASVSQVRLILDPLRPQQRSATIAFIITNTLTPVLVECILLLRVLAVYPPRQLSKLKACALYIPLVLLKVARIINIAIFWSEFVRDTLSSSNAVDAGQRGWRTHSGAKIEWYLQLFDNTITSALFLYRLRLGRKLSSSTSQQVESRNGRSSYAKALKGLFWIAVSNFVFPVALSLCQLIYNYRDPNYLKGSSIVLTNVYVEIISVLFATIWTVGFHRDGIEKPSVVASLPTARFQIPEDHSASSSSVGYPPPTGESNISDNTGVQSVHTARSLEKMVFTLPEQDAMKAV